MARYADRGYWADGYTESELVVGGAMGGPRRYLDRVEQEERDELETLNVADAETEAAPAPKRKKQEKQLVKLPTYIYEPPRYEMPPVIMPDFSGVTSGVADLGRLLGEHAAIRRQQAEQVARAAAAAEAQRIDDEEISMLLGAM